MYAKLGNGTVRDLTQDTNTVYTHPATKQCNYSYTHPATRVCSVGSSEIPWTHIHTNCSINIKSTQYNTTEVYTVESIYNLLLGKMYKIRANPFSLTWTAGFSYPSYNGSVYSIRFSMSDITGNVDQTVTYVNDRNDSIVAGKRWTKSFNGGETTFLAACIGRQYQTYFSPIDIAIITPDYYNRGSSAPVYVTVTGTIPLDIWYINI